MTTGRIIRLKPDHGFGFIQDTSTGREYFFHQSAVQNAEFRELSEQQAVTFEPGQGPKGLRTESVYVA